MYLIYALQSQTYVITIARYHSVSVAGDRYNRWNRKYVCGHLLSRMIVRQPHGRLRFPPRPVDRLIADGRMIPKTGFQFLFYLPFLFYLFSYNVLLSNFISSLTSNNRVVWNCNNSWTLRRWHIRGVSSFHYMCSFFFSVFYLPPVSATPSPRET